MVLGEEARRERRRHHLALELSDCVATAGKLEVSARDAHNDAAQQRGSAAAPLRLLEDEVVPRPELGEADVAAVGQRERLSGAAQLKLLAPRLDRA